jgi:hypothetical protein
VVAGEGWWRKRGCDVVGLEVGRVGSVGIVEVGGWAQVEPLIQFGGVGVDGGAAAAGDAMDGETAVRLPALDGAFASAKIGGDFFPRIQTRPGRSIFRF